MNHLASSPFEPPAPVRRSVVALFRAAALVAGFSVLSGCLSRPPLKIQTFAFEMPAPVGNDAAASAPVLGLRTISVAPPFAGRSLVYRTGEFSYERDPYAQFLDFPEQELAAPLRAGLGAQGDFSSVVMAAGIMKPDVIVEIHVSQLFGDFREPNQPKAILRARFTFYQATNGIAAGIILQKEYLRSIALEKPAAAALMAGWNRALNEILAEALTDYRQHKT